MNYIKRLNTHHLIATLLLVVCSMVANAQNGGTHSSYSRFGLGLLNDQAQAWNRAMGSVGIALPSGNKLNTMNPASYAHIDSLSFILDAGMSGNFGHMSMANKSISVNNASFDYLAAGFRLRKNFGLSFGFRPYSTIGYNYYTTSNKVYRDHTNGKLIRYNTNYLGKGGIYQVFAGIGWKPFRNFSIGTNASLLWGGYDHVMMQNVTEDGASSSNFDCYNFIQHAKILTYKLDFGLQYAFRISPKDWLTLGATVELGHQFDGEAFLYRFMTTGDTLTINGEKNGFDIPMSYAGGIAWHHKNTLTISADAHYQAWGDCRIPTMVISNNSPTYNSSNKMYKNRYTINVGAEYSPNPLAPKGYYNRIRYRMGVAYNSPYMNIPIEESQNLATTEGPSELRINLGVGLPIINYINNRHGVKSVVNLGVEWLHRAPSSRNLVTENYIILNLGVTFNERWFQKFKIQ